ncbi:hypothetical protein GCM10027063_16140 [Promicromonospora xylanilytica]
MATEHDPRALDAPIQPGGVPRHASAQGRRSKGLGPFLSDLKAEVQNQLSRADAPARSRAAQDEQAQDQPTEVLRPGGRTPGLTAGPQTPAPLATDHADHAIGQAAGQAADHAAALASAALAAADHAGASADAARTEAAAARTDADAARTEADAARADAVTAQATAGRADAHLQAVRAEIAAAHQEFEALRAEIDAARERTRRHVLIAWIGAGAAAVLAGVALVLGL